MKIFFGFFVPENPLGDQAAKLDQSRYPGAGRNLEHVVRDPTESQCTQADLVHHSKQTVALLERSTAFASGKAALASACRTPA